MSADVDPIVRRAVSGCTMVIRFDSDDRLARGVGTLLGCGHGHHFVVMPDAGIGRALACSEHAISCLREHLGDELGRYSGSIVPPPRVPISARPPF